MKSKIFYSILFIGVIFSCKKEDITKQHFNSTDHYIDSTNHANDSIRHIQDSLSHLDDSFLNIINNPAFGGYPGKIKTMSTLGMEGKFYYYNDGRIAKMSLTNSTMSEMNVTYHSIFYYQPDGFTIKVFSKTHFAWTPNEYIPYAYSAILEYKTDANHFITNVKDKIIYGNVDSLYDEVKISYTNNKFNKIEMYYNNALQVPYYNNFLYDVNDNLTFRSLNAPLWGNNQQYMNDSVFCTYTNFTDEAGLNSDINLGIYSAITTMLPVKYTGTRIPTSDKLVKIINSVSYEYQTNIPLHTIVTNDYEFNSNNKLIRINRETKNYDGNSMLKDSSTISTDLTYY